MLRLKQVMITMLCTILIFVGVEFIGDSNANALSAPPLIDSSQTYEWEQLGELTERYSGNQGFSSAVSNGIPYIAIINQNTTKELKIFKYVNNAWVRLGDENDFVGPIGYNGSPENIEYVSLTVMNDIPFVAYASGGGANNLKVKYYNSTNEEWIQLGSEISSNAAYMKLRFSPMGELYLLYTNDPNTYLKKYNYTTNTWNDVGGVINNARMASLAFNNNDPVVLAMGTNGQNNITLNKLVNNAWQTTTSPSLYYPTLEYYNGQEVITHLTFENDGTYNIISNNKIAGKATNFGMLFASSAFRYQNELFIAAEGEVKKYNNTTNAWEKATEKFSNNAVALQNSLHVDNNILYVAYIENYTTPVVKKLAVKQLSSNADLNSLTLSNGTLSPTFSPEVTSYTSNVGNNVENITVTGEVYDTNSNLKINNTDVTSGTPSPQINLNVGENIIPVEVTAEDGTTTKTYTIKVTRAAAVSTIADLKSLTISAGTLNPTFSPTTTSYTTNVENNVNSMTVTGEVYDTNSTLKVNGTAITSGTASSAINLIEGKNTISVAVTAEDGTTTKTYTIEVTRSSISGGSNGGGSGSSGGSGGSGGSSGSSGTSTPASTGVEVLVNGKVENAGTATTTEINGQKITIIKVDAKKIEEKLAAEGQKSVVTIPINTQSNKFIGELNGQIVKNMEQKEAVVEIKTEKATYTLPAGQINIDAISNQIGQSVALQDIKIQIEIAAPTNEVVKIVENSATKGNFTIVAPPIEFTVNATHGDSTIEVSKFNAYVERTIALPDGIDPNKITTGVVVDLDGTVRHVPTKITVIDGKYYAKINSLTNSTYSVVWHPLEFKDVENHWAKDSVNNMGSRMVVTGTGDEMFTPDKDITRAEFAAIIVRGLGLKLEKNAGAFNDVNTSDWYSSAVQTAANYKLINGFEDGSFRPNEKITREQAMTIIAKAMNLTSLKQEVTASDIEKLNSFTDVNEVANWAKQSIANSVKNGIVNGRSNSNLTPKENMSRAEVAAIIERLLKKAELL